MSCLTAKQVLKTFCENEFWQSTYFTWLSLEPLCHWYCWVTKIIANAKGYLQPKTWKIYPNRVRSIEGRKVADPGLLIKLMKNQFAKKPRSPLESTLQISWEVQISRSVNMSESTVYRTSRKVEHKYTLQFLKSLMDSIFGRFQRFIDSYGEILKWLSPILKQFLERGIHLLFVGKLWKYTIH